MPLSERAETDHDSNESSVPLRRENFSGIVPPLPRLEFPSPPRYRHLPPPNSLGPFWCAAPSYSFGRRCETGRVVSPIRLLKKTRRRLVLATSLTRERMAPLRRVSLGSEHECKSLALRICSPQRLARRPPQNNNSSWRRNLARQTGCGEVSVAVDPPCVAVDPHMQPEVGENRLH